MEQKESFNVLGEQPVGRLLMHYAIPAIVAMTASSVYNIIDGIFIGQGVGKEAIMGLALTGPVMSLTAAFGAMVGVGASTLMSVRLGGTHKAARRRGKEASYFPFEKRSGSRRSQTLSPRRDIGDI